MCSCRKFGHTRIGSIADFEPPSSFRNIDEPESGYEADGELDIPVVVEKIRLGSVYEGSVVGGLKALTFHLRVWFSFLFAALFQVAVFRFLSLLSAIYVNDTVFES